MYLDNDAGPDMQVPLFITSPEIDKLRELLKRIRPSCDDCGADLSLQVGARDQAGKSFPSAWVCSKCGVVYYSNLTPKEWLEELKNEAREQNILHPDEHNRPGVPTGRKAIEV